MVNESSAQDETWIVNSAATKFGYSQPKLVIVWTCFCIAVFCLCHSIWIHKFRRHKIRTFSEIALTITIFNCIMLHISGLYPESKFISAICQDFLSYGVFACGMQVIDNYFVYTLYLTTESVPLWQKVFINLHIWITLLCFFPFVTVVPFFVDLNTTLASTFFNILGRHCWSALYILYNLYFGWKIWSVIRRRFSSSNYINSVVILSYRNIIRLICV